MIKPLTATREVFWLTAAALFALACVTPTSAAPHNSSKTITKTAYSQPGKAATKPESGYLIELSSKIFGVVTLLCSPNRVRMTFANSNVTTVAHAPDWHVTQFSPTTHKFAVSTYEKFTPMTSKVELMMSGHSLDSVPVSFWCKRVVMGINANELKSSAAYYAQQMKLSAKGQMDHAGQREVFVTVSADPKLSQRVGGIVSTAMGLPHCNGVPLAVHFTDIDGDDHVYLTTHSVKAAQVTAKDAQAPAGFTRVTDTRQLYSDPGRDAIIDDTFFR